MTSATAERRAKVISILSPVGHLSSATPRRLVRSSDCWMVYARVYMSTEGKIQRNELTSKGAREEVDGVRKEKERLTTDHQPQGNVRWLMVVNLSLFSFVPLTINRASRAPFAGVSFGC